LIPHIDAATGTAYNPASFAPEIRTRVAIEGRYAPYLKRQEKMAQRFQQDENLLLPADLDYSQIFGISNEEKQALERVRPTSVGMARRIEGVTPAGALRLLMHVRRGSGFSREVPEDPAVDAVLGSSP
jgi:tRNA uridine 5-carboxymethylaminomethyl modification enzyme